MTEQAFLASSLGSLAVQAGRRFHADLFDSLAARGFPGIRPRHSSLLLSLDAGGTRLSVLAERTEVTVQSMSELVDDLERAGYLERSADPLDRRARVIRLTEQGKVAVDECLAALDGIEQTYAERLGAARYDDVRSALRDLTGRARLGGSEPTGADDPSS